MFWCGNILEGKIVEEEEEEQRCCDEDRGTISLGIGLVVCSGTRGGECSGGGRAGGEGRWGGRWEGEVGRGGGEGGPREVEEFLGPRRKKNKNLQHCQEQTAPPPGENLSVCASGPSVRQSPSICAVPFFL